MPSRAVHGVAFAGKKLDMKVGQLPGKKRVPCSFLPETESLHLKMDDWNLEYDPFLLGFRPMFRGRMLNFQGVYRRWSPPNLLREDALGEVVHPVRVWPFPAW